MTTTTRKTGQSFQPKPKFYPYKDDKGVKIGNKTLKTAAQIMTLIGYGDIQNLPVRSLDYCVKCESFADLMACIEIIDSYNEFDAARIKKAAFWELNKLHYLNSENPNNGKNLFDFHIARESSPAFYVKWNGKYNTAIIKDKEPLEATATQEAGEMLFWEEYTEEDFRASMSRLGDAIGADEFSIENPYTYQTGEKCLTARFWFN